jgi:TldD protein
MIQKNHKPFIEDLIFSSNQINENDIERIFKSSLSNHFDYADLYFQYSKNEYFSIEDGEVKNATFNIDNGAGLRVNSKEKTAFAYTDEINLETLKNIAISVQTIKNQTEKTSFIPPQNKVIKSLYQPIDPINNDNNKKINLLKRLDTLTRKIDPRIKKVNASLALEFDAILILNSNLEFSSDIRPLVRLSLSVIVEENKVRESGSSGGGGRFDLDYFTDDILNDYAHEAVDQAITNLKAVNSPAGEMTVVLGPGWPGILLHEAIGHGLEGDFNRKKTSAFSNLIGKQVAHKDITVIDDGTIKDKRGSLNIDDEGNPTQKTTLIENGILTGYLQDTLNARLMNTKPTGNGRRESYAYPPLPRMTNTMMINGKYEPAEIIKSVKKGLYATNFGGGQVDIVSGKFVFSASQAFLIENGKITKPVKGSSIVGNGPDILKKVSMLGNDTSLDSGVGTCGKDGQSVPVGVGQPTLKIDQIVVGGAA